jgi:Trypsin-co-occurring domain 1
MSRLVTFQLDAGGSFVAEVDDRIEADKTMRGLRSPAELIQEPAKTFEAAIQHARRAAESLVDQFRSLSSKPDEVSVEFGVKLSSETGAIIAKASADANFSITLTWKRAESEGR